LGLTDFKMPGVIQCVSLNFFSLRDMRRNETHLSKTYFETLKTSVLIFTVQSLILF